jgi:hypothetical protein
MPYLSEADIRGRARSFTQPLLKSASSILTEDGALPDESFDVFLSHSSAEPAELLLGVKLLLEEYGLSVYVDKYGDPWLSPDKVTAETAKILRRRMRSSNALLYIHSQHSKKSRWMPWELGFFDGLKGNVGIVPVTGNQEETFKDEEYLSLYPYVDVANDGSNARQLWVNKSPDVYARLNKWAKGEERIEKR